MRKLAITLAVILLLSLGCGIALSACVDVRVGEDGTVIAGGVKYKIDGQFATVVGYDPEGGRRLKILSEIVDEELGIDAEVTIIAENAFSGADIDQIEFDDDFERLTIYPNAFAGSTVKNIEDFPYTNVTLMDNALAGMSELTVISVRGDSRERGCYYIGSDGGLYGVGNDGKVTLYLVPAAKQAANTYTITANIVAPGAFSCNKSINTVFVTEAVTRICVGAFANVKMSRLSCRDATAEIYVEDGAFEVDKDMRFEVSADSVEVLEHWIKLSDGEQLEMLSGLIHPIGCTMTEPHIHGLSEANASYQSTSPAPATSLEGIPYQVSDANHYRITIGESVFTLQYLFTTFTAA